LEISVALGDCKFNDHGAGCGVEIVKLSSSLPRIASSQLLATEQCFT
jgi:hypothetical protein